MALKHADIWRAIDSLAEREGLSPSGLAKKAGLSPTIFNPSKRSTETRKRWPSTESIAQILQVTNTGLDEFVALTTPNKGVRVTIPFLRATEASRIGIFDEEGHPTKNGWDEMYFPLPSDPHAFALEIEKDIKPFYTAGTIVIVSPAEKPRRGDKILMMVRKEGLQIGELNRESPQKIELTSATFPRNNIEWMHRIVWASQ